MERIDYDSYTRRAHQLRACAIAEFQRAIVTALTAAYRAGRRALADALNRPAPTARTC